MEFFVWSLILIFFFFFDSTACAILVLQPGIELVPPTVEAQSLNYWTAREVPPHRLPEMESRSVVSNSSQSHGL